MTLSQPSIPHRKKHGLRRRMVASLLGLAAVPMLLALTSLYFVAHDDVTQVHTTKLSVEAQQLAERMRAEKLDLDPLPDSPALQRLLQTFSKPEIGTAVVFDDGGKRLAGAAATPVPPLPEEGGGWTDFSRGGEQYLAGVAPLSPPGVVGHRYVAVVQPATLVYRHFDTLTGKALFLLIFCAAIAIVLAWWMTAQFLRPILEIGRGAEIISRINLGHRIQLDTDDELEELADAFNHMAANLGNTYQELERRVQLATESLLEERNRLATVLRTMADGVVVANAARETILMNPRARLMLERGPTSRIGAPLSRLLPADRVEFHLQRVRRNWERGVDAVERVVFPLPEGKLLTGNLSAVPGQEGELAAFLLVLRDLRASTETAVPSPPRELLEDAVAGVTGLAVTFGEGDEQLPLVKVEPFAWVAALRSLLGWLSELGHGRLTATLTAAPATAAGTGIVSISFRVHGPLDAGLAQLERREISLKGEDPLLLGEVVRRNKGELSLHLIGPEYRELRLTLPAAGEGHERTGPRGLIEGEPEFYNFDLFLPRPVIEKKGLLDTALTDLEYVVLDTETTGLKLSQGDRIVSISGIRIRRGKIVQAEIFHSLVNPGRPIPRESTEIHHIDDGMVADAPGMAEVYPQFLEFAGDCVLVAHNAAFDKRALDLAAADTGQPQLDNPMLDTLFLSYGMHEGTERHSLDALTERLGIVIEGRHSSLGDARATAQAFLKLISLLPARGVNTLGEAKEFCDKQLLLRWQNTRY